MKNLGPSRVLKVPLGGRRSLCSSPRLCAQAGERPQRPKERDPSPTRKKHRPSPLVSKGSSKINARLNDVSRAGTASQGHDPKVRLRQHANGKYTGRHALFRNTVLARFQNVLAEMKTADFSSIGLTEENLNQEAVLFMNDIDNAFLLAEKNVTRRDQNPLFWNLRDAFIQKDAKGLQSEIKYSFQSFVARERFSKTQDAIQQRLLDFRFPQEWFPGTREVQRTFHVHVGPTNSGKTYNALKALEASRNGVYAGPLRLLATEVYQRMTAKGVPCALVTGEEVRQPEDTDQYLTSCTVEMIPMNKKFDVAVIDEIQMLNDPDRGNAWTMALLGVQAKEVHLCGEERTVKLIQALCASIGDKCIIHRYERLTPLMTMDTALDNNLSKLEKGDAIVAFSRLSLHALKRNIEKQTGRRCAIIYGSLPPEVRVKQAALFNDPNNDYDYIVASDAIGMGLNLEIRRVVLESITKFDGSQNRHLSFPEIKQIGGRAGRYRTAANPDGANTEEAEQAKVGLVTSMEYADLSRIHMAFVKEVEDIKHAYIEAPAGIIERFASYYPSGTPLSFILQRVRMLATLSDRFRFSLTSDHVAIADIVQDFDLPIWDKLTFCNLPVRLTSQGTADVVRALAKVLAENLPGDLLSIKEIPLEYLDLDMRDTKQHGPAYLQKMEALHDAVNQYVWLSYRYSGTFRDQALAFHIRSLVEDRLIDLLDRLNFTDKDLERHRRKGRLEARSRQMNREAIGEALVDHDDSKVQDLDESREATLV